MTPKGKRVGSHVVETNARCLIEAVRQIPEPRHICLEEGRLSEWLHEELSPHAEKVVVVAVVESRGPKDDRRMPSDWRPACGWERSSERSTRSGAGSVTEQARVLVLLRPGVRARTGDWVKAEVKQTRGLNRNFNRTLKAIFKGAATTVIGRKEDDPIYRHYLRLLDGGTKPNLAKLTIARQIASIVLALWRAGEVYDRERLAGASRSD